MIGFLVTVFLLGSKLEVHRGTKLYILADELMRWRSLLDTRFIQYKLERRRTKELYSL